MPEKNLSRGETTDSEYRSKKHSYVFDRVKWPAVWILKEKRSFKDPDGLQYFSLSSSSHTGHVLQFLSTESQYKI